MKKRIILKGIKQKEYLDLCISQLTSKEVHEVIIKPYKKNRSLEQNALYWVWIEFMSKLSDMPKNQFHHLLATQYLEPDIYEMGGHVYTRVRSTTELSVAEFNEYLMHIEVFAAETGTVLPQPEGYKIAMGIKEL